MQVGKLMKPILLIFLLPLFSFGQKDILLHNLAGTGITIGTGYLSYKITDKPFLSGCIGLGLGIISGIAKEEIWDRKWKRGTYSENDMLATGWGSCVGTVCLTVCIDLNRKKETKKFKKYKSL